MTTEISTCNWETSSQFDSACAVQWVSLCCHSQKCLTYSVELKSILKSGISVHRGRSHTQPIRPSQDNSISFVSVTPFLQLEVLLQSQRDPHTDWKLKFTHILSLNLRGFFFKGNMTQGTSNLTCALHKITLEEAAATAEKKTDACSYGEIWILKYHH